MKFILIAAFLFVQAFALPVEDEPAFDLLMDEFDETDECRALLTGEVSSITISFYSRQTCRKALKCFSKFFPQHNSTAFISFTNYYILSSILFNRVSVI